MIFSKIKNIDQALKGYQRFTLVICIGSLVVLALTAWLSYRLQLTAGQRIYLLSNGITLSANSSGRKENLNVEARGHVRFFHEAFFSLDPDEKVIAAHRREWLYLADASAKKLDDSLSTAGYYANIVAGNVSQRIHIDSIGLDMPHFRCYATLDIIRSTSTATRSLITEGDLRMVERSDHNLQGFLIQNWRITENKDLKIINH